MKLYKIGYPGSQRIKKASDYLTTKYMPDFEVIHINHQGKLEEWSKFILSQLNITPKSDKYIVMALDDYLLNSPLNQGIFWELLVDMEGDKVCAKLCDCTKEENEEYPVTTQYCIWNKAYLISLLERTTTPWDFELSGSKMFKADGKKLLWGPALHYYTNSSLSKRWEGIRLDGLNEEDIKEVQKLL